MVSEKQYKNLEEITTAIENEYSKLISKTSNIFFILTIENEKSILSSQITTQTNKYRKTIGIPIKDASNYNITQIEGKLFKDYMQLESGLVVPREFAEKLSESFTKYTPARKITMCVNYHL